MQPKKPTVTPRSPLRVRDVAARLAEAKLGSGGHAFCAYLWQQTLGNMDEQEVCSEANAWCDFDLAAWRRALGWERSRKSNLRRIRDLLETTSEDRDHILALS